MEEHSLESIGMLFNGLYDIGMIKLVVDWLYNERSIDGAVVHVFQQCSGRSDILQGIGWILSFCIRKPSLCRLISIGPNMKMRVYDLAAGCGHSAQSSSGGNGKDGRY